MQIEPPEMPGERQVEQGKNIIDTGSKFKPFLQAEFPMWGYDYARLNNWLMWIEYWSAVINSKETASLDELQNYFASLNVLYKALRVLLSNKEQIKDYDEYVARAKKIKRTLEAQNRMSGAMLSKGLIIELTDILDKIHTALMELRQVVNLGIPVRITKSSADRIKEGFRSTKKPELPVDVG